jgi:carbonic anhydrase/acetyltransferase-like protein (isoleucine patch superfamily)
VTIYFESAATISPQERLRMGHIGKDVTADASAWIHESAQLHGCVSLGAQVSVWPNVVMRSEIHHIQIGDRTNIQDFVMVHVGYRTPTIIGEDCSITHHATLHGCELGDRCLVGINATVMDGARIGANSIVAGHSIVTENAQFPENSIVAGVPAKLIKTLDNSAANVANARFYVLNAEHYAKGIERLPQDAVEQILADL